MPDNTDILGELGIDPNATPQFGGTGQEMTYDAANEMGLINIMSDLGIDYEGEGSKLKYFEQYDDIKEDMAGMVRGQSEQEAQQGYSQALTGAQGQVGQALGQAYARGRAGGGGFGGSSDIGRIKQATMKNYDQAKMGAQQQMQGQMFDAQMTEAKAIKASRDAYQQQIMQLLGMLQE
jgi:hypothetical protein